MLSLADLLLFCRLRQQSFAPLLHKFISPRLLPVFLAVSAAVGGIQAAEEMPSRGRVCLSVVEPGPPAKELPLRTTSVARPGEKVNVYLDASMKCIALVVALTPDGKLANGWRPQFAEVPEDFEEVQLPRAPVTWEWTAQAVPLEIYVLFMQPDSTDAEEAKRLISAMQSLKLEDRILEMQTNKLRELIGRIASEKQKSNQTLFKDPEVGGVFRGNEFPWRQFAQSVTFSDDRPGVLILASEGGGKAVPVGQ
jgi:hypothetical protein